MSFIGVDSATYGGLSQAPPPPVVAPTDPPPPDSSPVGIALAGLNAASNLGVPHDVAGSAQGDLDRRTHAADAAAKFPANESDAAQQFQAVGTPASAQMIQQVVSGITGAIGGVIGGILAPLAQVPLQVMQAGEAALQPLMSAVQAGHSAAVDAPDGSGPRDGAGAEPATEPGAESAAELGGDPGHEPGGGPGAEPGDAAGPVFGGAAEGGTSPTGSLGPPPVPTFSPTASPPTTPAGASARPPMMAPTGGPFPTSGQPGLAGMPVMPPGAIGGHAEGGRKDGLVEKRVAVPSVPNGQPIKGRLTIPPGAPPTTKSTEGKPAVATTRPARRIVIMPPDEETRE